MSRTIDRNALLNRLNDTRKHSPVPVVAQALYLYLVNEAEAAPSGAAMPLSDRRIALDLCISVQRMRRARAVLVELGLVRFTPTHSRREFPLYSFDTEEKAPVDESAEPVAAESAAVESCPAEMRCDTVKANAAVKSTAYESVPPRLSAFERMKRRSLKRAAAGGGQGRGNRNGHNKSA